MIGYLKGEIAALYDDKVVLEVNNVGYNIFMPTSCIEKLSGIGEEVKIHTFLNVREDALQLFGFLTKDDLEFFKLLISVNGIGPKGGLAILSCMSTDDLRFAILSEDAKRIGKAPGIGPKTAQRVIIELKDKVNLEDAFEEKLNNTRLSDESSDISSPREDAAMALIALGYSSADSYKAVKSSGIKPDDDVETIIKKALKSIVTF